MIGSVYGIVRTSDHAFLFVEQSGATIVSRGGRLYLRVRGGYEELDMATRAIVASGHGFVITSDAVQVCARRHIEIVLADATQSFIAIYAAYAQSNASRAGMAVRMRQFAAIADMRKRLVVAKDIVRRKIIAEEHETAMRCAFLGDLEGCKSTTSVRHIEAKSAQEWWRQWKNFQLHFAKGFKPPEQWHTFKSRYIGRRQGKSGELPRQFTARFAETPLQALHNVVVSITTARLVRVIAARGYDPCFGFLHDGRKPGRYSFAWDAVEVLRPALAEAVFRYARERV
jgi:CRISPR/Cas system-associated endonuclease Cas1